MPIPELTVVGLDAATFDVIDPLVQAGDLPNLARLLEGGARGSLRSTTHPLTPLAWTTMVTGVNAGRHGIWDFTERDSIEIVPDPRLIEDLRVLLLDRIAGPAPAPATPVT